MSERIFFNEITTILPEDVQSMDIGAETNVDCFGKHATHLVFSGKFGEVSVTYDIVSDVVLQVTVYNNLNDDNYTFFDEEIRIPYDKECKAKNWDDKWCTTDSSEDILNKISAIMNCRKYDKDVVIMFDIDDETKELLIKQAFERKMNMDEYIAHLLLKMIEEEKKGNVNE